MKKHWSTLVTSFALHHPVWLFCTCLLVAAYALMQLSHQLTWGNYLQGWGVLLLCFSPTLVFVAFRKNWQKRLGDQLYRLTWVVVFLAYPFSLWWSPLTLADLGLATDFIANQSLVLPLIGGCLLLLELCLWWQRRNGDQSEVTNWVLSWSLGKVALIVVLIFSFGILFFNNYFQEQVRDYSKTEFLITYFFLAIQLFLIYISYYWLYYLHHHFLFNSLLRKKGIVYYLLGISIVLLGLIPIHNTIISWFPVVHTYKMHTVGISTYIFDDLNLTIPLLILLLSFPLIVIIEWYRQVNTVTVLEKEKSATELSLLKQQINPHFFFNTLNNLYAMSLTKEEETPETILQLSKLMRYVIYKGQNDQVTLKEEMQYLQDYIDLQTIRLHKELDLRFETEIETSQQTVPPLLFVILIENAFKHGIEPAAKDCFLHLKLSSTTTHVQFECFNSIPADSPSSLPGIGLKNLRRRLDLLFPDRYQLNIQKTPTDYLATLTLEL